MSALDLVFRRALPAGGMSLGLVFGGTGGGGSEILPVTVTGTTVLGRPVSAAAAIYDNRLPWTVSAAATARHQAADRADTAPVASWGQPAPISADRAAPWQSADRAGAAPAAPWGLTERVGTDKEAVWQHGAPVSRSLTALHQVCSPVEVLAAIGWQLATPLSRAIVSRHQVADALQILLTANAQGATPLSRTLLARHQVATPAQRALLARWQSATRLIPPGLTVYVPPGGGGIAPHPVSLDLVFACPPYVDGAPLDLVFGHVCLPGPLPAIVIPVRSYYMVQNDVTLYRLPSGTEFQASAFTLDIDADSWTFGWSASLHSSARPHLARNASGDRAEVQCVVNGINLHLVIDSVGRDKKFPEHRIMVRGRGRAAELGDASLTFGNAAARTAQQLMADVLTVNNVSMGWDIDWQIEDWLVPAGAWLHRGSYISALQDIAGAAGAYLQPHLTDKVLRVLPRYPIGPWDWATDLMPDVELPVDATTTENVDEIDRPDYNGVWVGGIGQGVFGPVVRTGTTGDKVAPQVLHPLITAPAAHRQAGLAVLGDAGRKERVSVSTLLLPEAGILMPGKVVRYVSDDGSRVGLVRRTGLAMQTWPQLTQTLEIETYVE